MDFLLGGSVVRRYHTADTIKEDLVGRHSHGVAMLLWRLSENKPSVNLIMAALVHDLGEQATGDVPSPTKRALGAEGMAALDRLEDATLREQGLEFELTPEEQRLLKIADCMDGMLYCVRERRLGNKNVRIVFERFKEYIYQIGCPNPEVWFAMQEVVKLWEAAHE